MYKLTSDFLHIEGESSFYEMWEVFCYRLISIDKNTDDIERFSGKDHGIDLYWKKKRIAYQCKSVASGVSSGFHGYCRIITSY
jgi:hypothetical protein